MKVSRGDIVYFRSIIDRRGNVQGGNRPYVVVSNDVGNEHSNICIAAPLTTRHKAHHLPVHVPLDRTSTVLCEQLFTFEQGEVHAVVRKLSPDEMQRVDEALRVSIGVKGYD